MGIKQFEAVALLVFMLMFFAGTSMAKRGGKHLSEPQYRDLAARGFDWVVIGCGGIAVLLGYLASQLRLWSLVGAVVAGTVADVRIYLRMYRQPWPQKARTLLFVGNVVLIGGPVLFAAIRALPYIRN